jgi:hypothetical protein
MKRVFINYLLKGVTILVIPFIFFACASSMPTYKYHLARRTLQAARDVGAENHPNASSYFYSANRSFSEASALLRSKEDWDKITEKLNESIKLGEKAEEIASVENY